MRQLYSATWLFSRVHDVALVRFLLARAFVWVSLALAPGCSIQLTEKAPALRRRRIRLRLQSLALRQLHRSECHSNDTPGHVRDP